MSRTCRFCATPLEHKVADLGETPLANSYLREEQIGNSEPSFPLVAYVCESCWLVQLEAFATPEHIFSDYAYFSSFSSSWLSHCKKYAGEISKKLGLNEKSLVVEVASNDGYLLQYFGELGIPTTGIEPAVNVAKLAQKKKGVHTICEFLGEATGSKISREIGKADLVIANNVLAHVPDINDFVLGLKQLTASNGRCTIEFPHLLKMLDECEFDTIYHEHFSYLSLGTLQKVFAHHGMKVFDVEELPTHGGSLRLHVAHQADESKEISPNVGRVLETEAKLNQLETYLSFQMQVDRVKQDLQDFLAKCKAEGKVVVAYGAPAKGNTLLNYCNVTQEQIPYTVDISTAKQGHYLPGSHLPIYPPGRIKETKPDYVLILPWNLTEEVVEANKHIDQWNGQFVVAIPKLKVFSPHH